MSILPGYVRAMLDPSFYPEMPSSVQLLQTQMSFVFIAGDFVYKTKKPVNLGYLDYTTLEARRHFCEREVLLNRRLCASAYLGVIPISREGHRVVLGHSGDTIEYAVKMKYLPQNKMLDVLLKEDRVTPEMIATIGPRLAQFHREAGTDAAVSAYGDMATIAGNTEENFDQTRRYLGRTISAARFDRISAYTRGFMLDNEPLFRSRVAQGAIRDCHGDLHAAHICFTDSICIYDCIEFNDRFRYGDVASEVSFLAMDLDHYGRGELSHRFVSSYVQSSGDLELLKLLPFYKCYRAYVRGKVESFKLDDAYLSPDDKMMAQQVASGYFDLASFYARPRPTLFITVGVTGTGKSTFSRALSKRIGLAVFSSDIVRKRLAGVPLTEHHFDEFGTGLYSEDFSRRTYDTMLDQAEPILSSGSSVILDAAFIKRSDRVKARMLADRTAADLFVIEFKAREETIRAWLKERSARTSVSDGRLEILGQQMNEFEPVDEGAESGHCILDPSQPIGDNISLVLRRLGEV